MRRALRHRSFRRLFAGRVVTNVGDSLYTVAAMWLVFELTGSSLYTGVAGALTMGPTALQAFAGPLVDRWALRRVLVGTQAIQAVLVSTIPVAHLLGGLSVWHVLAVMPLVSLCNQFGYPAQTAAIPRLVPPGDLVGANSAMSLAHQGVDMAFNAVAGVAIALVGAVAVYALDAATFLLAAALFAGVAVPRSDPPGAEGDDVASGADSAPGDDGSPEDVAPSGGDASAASVDSTVADGGADGGADVEADAVDPSDDSRHPVDPADPANLRNRDGSGDYRAELAEGIAFVRGTVLLPLLVPGVVANATLAGTLAVLPAFAAGRGGAGAYGLLVASITAGMLTGALVASRFDEVPYGRLAIGGFLLSGVAWFGAVAVAGTLPTAALLALAMVPVGVTNVVTGALIQTLVPDGLLGRVTAATTSVSTAMMPAGSLLGGAVAAAYGPTPVVAAAGGGLLFIAGYTLARPRLRALPPVTEAETLAP